MSSYLTAAPEALAAAASEFAGLGEAIDAATVAAATRTTAIVAAAQDEVSAAVAALFGGHGRRFQALSAQASAFHDRFVGLLRSGSQAYAAAEAANASPSAGLSDLAIFKPVEL